MRENFKILLESYEQSASKQDMNKLVEEMTDEVLRFDRLVKIT